MVQLQRNRTRRDTVDGAGNSCLLISEHVSLRVGSAGFGVGGSYERPVGVERDGSFVPITDVVMVVRIAALLAVTLALIVGVIRR